MNTGQRFSRENKAHGRPAGVRRTANFQPVILAGFVAFFLSAGISVHAQGGYNLGFADYQNIWYTSGPVVIPELGGSDYAGTITTVYHGHVGPYATPGSGDTPTTPTDGSVVLWMSSFAQPVGGRTFFGPDYRLGEEIIPPDDVTTFTFASIVDISPPTHAFYVASANKLFAGDIGLLTITWLNDLGSTAPRQYIISNETIQPPVRIYHTEAEKGGLVDFSGAPQTTIHYNTAVTAPSKLWMDGSDRLHATTDTGMLVLHYEEGPTTFAGIEIVEVRTYVPDFTTSLTYVGTILTPTDPPTSPLIAPTVSRGDEGPMPYAFQYGQNKRTTVALQVFPVRPTTAGGPIVTHLIMLYWKRPGRYPDQEWPYELHAYGANWDPATDWQRIYYTADGSLGPPVDVGNIDILRFFYNHEITTTNTIYEHGAPNQIRAGVGGTTETGRILLAIDDFNSPEEFVLEFVEIFAYLPDGITHLDVGSPALPTRVVADPLQPQSLVKRGWNGNPKDPVNFAYQHAIAGDYRGAVFAVRPNTLPTNMEVFFKRLGKKNLVWPYEMRRYTAEWPVHTQLLVRGTHPSVPGVRISLPSELHTALMPFQEMIPITGPREEVQHATFNSNQFFSDITTKDPGDYYALLQYQIGPQTSPGSDWVGFQPVRCVKRTDTRFFPLGSLHGDWPWDRDVAWRIGIEITDPYHTTGPLPGVIYHVHGVDNEDKYDPIIYEEGGTGAATGQIFPVFPGLLEVWWSNVTTQGLTTENYRVQWPSLVKRYNCDWPTTPELMVIASEVGSEQIPFAHKNPDVYYQNDATKLGYNPNYEHASLFPLDSGVAAFALRCDLNQESAAKPVPHVLVKYQDTTDNELWRFRVFRVVPENAQYRFRINGTAGTLLRLPYPLAALPEVSETTPGLKNGSYPVSGPHWRDRNRSYWARAAADNGTTAEIVMRDWYPVQEGFVFPRAQDNTLYPPGVRTPWLNKLAAPFDQPVNIYYTIAWPDEIPVLQTAETLVVQKFGLPNIIGQCSVEVVYESLNHSNPHVSIPGQQNVVLIDPIREREVNLDALPTGANAIQTANIQGKMYFSTLPPHLHDRVSYDPINKKLELIGDFFEMLGEDIVLLNVLTTRDREFLYGLGALPGQRNADPAWIGAVDDLYEATSQPILLTPQNSNSAGKAVVGVSAANSATTMPYVVLAMQNHESCRPLPVSLEIIRVTDDLYRGEIKVIEPACVFDEQLTLRHTGDFGGKAGQYTFKWDYHPDMDGLQPPNDSPLWRIFPTEPPSGSGALDVTIRGASIFTISDNWFRVRYRKTTDPDQLPYYSTLTVPQLAPGWIKRVVGRINPFTQRASGGGIQGAEERFSVFQTREVNTVVSMISQAGPRWEGSVPLNCGPGLDDLGLIEIYDTVLGRGKELSIDAGFRYPPANNALLLAAGRIADLYMLLGNEAYADASDPTIAFGTDDGEYGTVASSIHCFMNQTASLLEEELALLRGRDDTNAPGVRVSPLYNRLMWNFTRDITGGEVAYALNYNIQDALGNADGTINELDAMDLYPQAHGDAWGHFLTAIKRYYMLLKHPNFDWVPRAEAVLVGGQPVTVDYLDERKFAKAAAAKARVGGEIVNLTYRAAYVEDPEGQWQGYKDTDANRAWGLSEWGSRAGQGTYFDWLTANAILPANDTQHTGIQKVDRTTVAELREIAASADQIQARIDEADLGLNPLGLGKNIVPFDIDPAFLEIGSGIQGETHFEQIYGRATNALANALTVFDHATNATQLLRRQSDSLTEFQNTVADQEADFNSRLIEVFGYPYAGDIGEGKTYAQGYDGPDLYHYDYVDVTALLGRERNPTKMFQLTLSDNTTVDAEGNVQATTKTVTYHVSMDGFGVSLPDGADWGQRRAPGEIQLIRSQLIQQYGEYERLRAEYSDLIQQIYEKASAIDARISLKDKKLATMYATEGIITGLNVGIAIAHEVNLHCSDAAKATGYVIDAAITGIPKSMIAGVAAGGDLTAPVRGTIKAAEVAGKTTLETIATIAEIAQQGMEILKEAAKSAQEIALVHLEEDYEVAQLVAELQGFVRQEHIKRLELLTQLETISQTIGEYRAALARGLRTIEDRTRFRTQTASKVQDYRYKDMAFRIFRNDALQKYRAQFDLAARYVYLTAKAYDYETNLLGRDKRAGLYFLTDIVRARAIGSVIDGEPRTGGGIGDGGLADSLARMKLNWDLVLKGQLGFNNPQIETNRFSLRNELFRSVDDETWREVLRRSRVDNLLTHHEFRRYCREFQPQRAVEPGLVLTIPTKINFGYNFFGRELAAGDSAYDSSNFATKIRAVGVWFSDYDALTSAGMSNTPRVYLIPGGYDIMRSPSEEGEIRTWKVLDQKLPVPFPIGPSSLEDPQWIPIVDTLSEEYAAIRKFSSFRAYHDSGEFDPAETVTDCRLIGRSVWNTRWLLIIPAGTLHADREKGLRTFIDGVSDIKLFFMTYAFSGN